MCTAISSASLGTMKPSTTSASLGLYFLSEVSIPLFSTNKSLDLISVVISKINTNNIDDSQTGKQEILGINHCVGARQTGPPSRHI